MKHLFRKKSVSQILAEIDTSHSEHQLKKDIRLIDLVSLGIAAVIGGGIFSTIGNASASGGPAVVFLFVFTAVACLFSALCYAEFASAIPISGSAYTYAYTSFGEIIAWILGWALVMEYAVGNIAVAISWSDYFTGLMAGIGWDIPPYFTMDYLSAYRGNKEFEMLIAKGTKLTEITEPIKQAHTAWQQAPTLFGLKLIADLPALLVTFCITTLVFIGIKESKNFSNIMVAVKITVILLVIIVGYFYINPQNWSNFAPNGISGVLKGVSAVFFAYIGFDAISTTAEECKNPQKDLPRAMIYTLLICTVLYILIALVMTGMVHYKELAVGDPLAFIFKKRNLVVMEGIVAISAIVAITSVFLVFQIGQPRILMTMSRDGLLPEAFSKIHPKFKTPYISTIATGIMVAVPALFLNLTEVTDLTSIGTLFAFTLVSGGILLLEKQAHHLEDKKRFRIPRYNSQYVIPLFLIGLFGGIAYQYPKEVWQFFTFSRLEGGFWVNFSQQFPMLCFILFCIFIGYACFRYKLSLIPVLGLLTNFYLMTELGLHNWIGFGIWLLLGLLVYFSYGIKNSKLRQDKTYRQTTCNE
ncbi:MAG: amino acid permease [Microscillaceae bacterium]|nr:amino acid permease [Microscillaceae bacterium]MDW8461778.1 amino acid permease [Cytophagales bacterium]